jgi:hypothetical protein
MSALTNLTSAIPVPDSLVEPATEKCWKQAQKAMSIQYPRSLYRLLSIYGSGSFRCKGMSFTVDNPCVKGYRQSIANLQDALRYNAEDSHDPTPYAFYPDDPGLLLCASSDTSVMVFFQVQHGKALEKRLVVRYGGYRWSELDTDIVSYLWLLVSGQIAANGTRVRSTDVARQTSRSWTFVPAPAIVADSPAALVEAVELRNSKEVRRLVKSGLDVNTADEFGRISIGSTNDEGMIRLLLSLGADPNVRGEGGMSPLAFSILSELPTRLIRELLDAGADPNDRDSSGGTPLIHAARTENVDVVQLLIERGARVNVTDKSKTTPLIAARNYPPIQEVLRKAGARR